MKLYMTQFKPFLNEAFKEIHLDDKLQLRYAISNLGRLLSFKESFEDGTIVKGSITSGYRIWRYKVREGDKIRHKHKLLYRLVSEYHLPNSDPNKKHVIHLDHNLAKDNVTNMRCVWEKERLEHQNKSPKVLEARAKWLEENRKVKNGRKLTVNQVKLIKRIIANPENKTRIKILAKRFGVSEMQIYRIKSGENWSKIEAE